MGFGFTGYLLPWDQKAYWATTVGANIAAQTPALGPIFSKLLKGGSEIGAATLTRFYACHVLVLPLVAGLLIAAHLFLVVWHGISEPPAEELDRELEGAAPRWHEAYAARYARLKALGKSFFPYATFRDVVVMVAVLGALAGLAWKVGAGLEDLADPTDAAYNPRPEWYFLFLFQALKFFPGNLESVAAVLLPGLTALLLVLIPFLDRGPARRPWGRPFWTSLGAAALAGWGYLTWAGYRSPMTNPVVPKDPAVLAGQRLYREMNCAYCHKIGGQGGELGPQLDKAAGRRGPQWLALHFTEPSALSRGSRMPKLNLLPDEIKALVAYLGSMPGAEPYTPQAPKLFAENCAVCHKLGGKGGEVGPDLTLIGGARDKSYIARYVHDPSQLNPSASMPGFKGQLTDLQIEDLARYLSSMGRPDGSAKP